MHNIDRQKYIVRTGSMMSIPIHKELLFANHVFIFMFSAFLKRVSYLVRI